MKTLLTPLLLLILFTLPSYASVILIALPSYASDLPPCPKDQSQTYDNCFGTYTFADGRKYVGEWKGAKRNGKGTLTRANGSSYVGEWKDDTIHGNGTYTWASGSKYVGEFKDNKKNGNGTITYPNGTVKSGIWADDKYLYDLAEHRRREENRKENDARTECAKEAGKANTEYAAKKIEEVCLEQKGYGKAWYEW